MSILQAIILGVIQGLTEFIPVSSSGHLLITHKIMGTNESTLGFDVALHVGTLVALLVYFRKDIWLFFINIFSKNKTGSLARLIAIATIPAVLAGLLFGDYIDNNLRSPLVVSVTLALVGVLMIAADSVGRKADKEVSMKQGLLVGLAQAAALIPGVSRSGATITTGLFLGLDKKQATRFSFLLAIPIVAGSALGLFLKGESFGSESSVALVLGMITAFVSGLFAIRFMLDKISKLGLKPFAYYRIILAIIVLLFLV